MDSRAEDAIKFANKYQVSAQKTFLDTLAKDYSDRFDLFPPKALPPPHLRGISLPLYPFLKQSDTELLMKVISTYRKEPTMEQRQVRHVLIIANWSKKSSHTLSQTIVDYLAEKGGIESSVSRTNKGNEPLVVKKDTDLVICLGGGDGTVLYCARYLQDLGIPILAINVGTFGYITEISVEEWQEAIDYFLEGKNTISRRLMIRVGGVFRKGKKVFTAHGLNEMVVSSSGISKVVSLSLRIGSTEAGFFRSDGMIIATPPTGSTGYSLAAGGPILDVDLTSLIITPPICPFTLSNRPLVVSGGDSTITLTIPKGQRTGLMLSIDGQQNFCLQEDDMIIVEKSQSKALLVASERRNYIEVLRDKLNWSGGGGLHA